MADINPIQLVLIGPQGVGKSSVADAISHRLRLPIYELDAHCLELYKADARFAKAAADLDALPTVDALEEAFRRLAYELGDQCHTYQESLHLLAVRLGLANSSAPIFDMGSGHCSYTIPQNQRELADLLAPHRVICLWPSGAIGRSAELLSRRNRRTLNANRTALEQHRGREIADHVIYVEDRTIWEVADEALLHIGLAQEEGRR